MIEDGVFDETHGSLHDVAVVATNAYAQRAYLSPRRTAISKWRIAPSRAVAKNELRRHDDLIAGTDAEDHERDEERIRAGRHADAMFFVWQ